MKRPTPATLVSTWWQLGNSGKMEITEAEGLGECVNVGLRSGEARQALIPRFVDLRSKL